MNRKIVDYDIIIGPIYGPKEKRFEGIMMEAIKNGFVPHGDIHILSNEERLLQAVIKYEEKEEKENNEIKFAQLSEQERTLDVIHHTNLKVLKHIEDKFMFIGNNDYKPLALLINHEAIPWYIEKANPVCDHVPPYTNAENCQDCELLRDISLAFKNEGYNSHLLFLNKEKDVLSFEETMYFPLVKYYPLIHQIAMVEV